MSPRLSLCRAKTALTEPTPATRSIGGNSEGLRGKSRLDERQISVQQTALRGSLEVFDLAHPAGQWVPSGTNLGHHLPHVRSVDDVHTVLSHAVDAVRQPAGAIPVQHPNQLVSINEVGWRF